MKKFLISALLAVFALSLVSAQVSTDPTDEFYDMVERWEIQGIISEQPPLRPYPLQRIEAILAEVIEGDNETEAELAEDYYERTFHRAYKISAVAIGNVRLGTEKKDDDKIDHDKQLIVGGGVGGDYSFPKIVTAGYDLNVYATNDITLDALPVFSAQPYYFRDSVDIKKLKAYWIMDASFAGGFENLYGQMGVNHLSFGPLYKSSTVVSPNAKHTANFSFVYATDRVSYTQALFGLSASNADDDIEDLFSKKFLTLHSLNGQIFPWLSASFYEVTIYGDRFEPAYMIPMPYIITQALSGFDDNTFMGLSFTIRPVPGFVWVNDIYIDDAGLGDLIRFNFDTKLIGTYQSAFKYAPENISWLDKVQLEYTMVTPYMYSHKQNLINPETGDWKIGKLGVINYQEYTTAGEALGLSLPPNTEQVELSASFTPVKRLKLTGRASYSRHCNINESLPEDEALSYLNSPEGYFVTDGGIHNHQHVLEDGDEREQGGNTSTYLDSDWNHFNCLVQDTKMHTFKAGFDAAYTVATEKFGCLSLDFGYTFEHIINYGVDREIFKAKGGKYVDITDDEGKVTGQKWEGNATPADIQKSIDEWRSHLTNRTNHYINFGVKYTW